MPRKAQRRLAIRLLTYLGTDHQFHQQQAFIIYVLGFPPMRAINAFFPAALSVISTGLSSMEKKPIEPPGPTYTDSVTETYVSQYGPNPGLAWETVTRHEGMLHRVA